MSGALEGVATSWLKEESWQKVITLGFSELKILVEATFWLS